MTKGYVTDADIAAEIREVAPGSSWADVKAAAAAVCRRLSSRDDDKTVAAFQEVLDRALAPMSEDRKRAEMIMAYINGAYIALDGKLLVDDVAVLSDPACDVYYEGIKRITAEFAAVRAERDEELVAAAREAELTIIEDVCKNNCEYHALCETCDTIKLLARLAVLVEGVGKCQTKPNSSN